MTLDSLTAITVRHITRLQNERIPSTNARDVWRAHRFMQKAMATPVVALTLAMTCMNLRMVQPNVAPRDRVSNALASLDPRPKPRRQSSYGKSKTSRRAW